MANTVLVTIHLNDYKSAQIGYSRQYLDGSFADPVFAEASEENWRNLLHNIGNIGADLHLTICDRRTNRTSFVDIGLITEYGLTQRLSHAIRVF